MTPQERNLVRAEASAMILAAMYANYIPNPVPRDETEEAAKARTQRENIRRMERALEAASAADALVAELETREEFPPMAAGQLPDHVVDMHGGHIPHGAHILHCAHGKASYEDCPECDAADAAEKAAAAAGGGTDGKTGEIATGGAV